MVEGNGLENRRGFTLTEGSNPSLSAKKKYDHLVVFFLASERGIFTLGFCEANMPRVRHSAAKKN